jgi:hypothetical protein
VEVEQQELLALSLQQAQQVQQVTLLRVAQVAEAEVLL